MNDLVTTVRNAVNDDFRCKDQAVNDNGHIELDSAVQYADVVSALYTLNHDNRFNFSLGYDQRLNLVTWLRSEDKAEYRVSAQELINELQSAIDAIKKADEERLISYVIKDMSGYYIETIDGSTDLSCNINLTVQ